MFINKSFFSLIKNNDYDFNVLNYLHLINDALVKGFEKINLEFAISSQVKRENSILYIKDHMYPLNSKKLNIIGAGKGTYIITKKLIEILGENFGSAIINIPKNQSIGPKIIPNTTIFKAGHPIPDKETFRGSIRQIEFLESLGVDDIVMVIITGGASSLFEVPIQAVLQDDLIKTYELLVLSGLSIHEINAIRKHLSSIKGGKLISKTKAQIITLLVSDVPGDNLSSIGSGPTIEDPSTFQDCLDSLQKSNITDLLPPSVLEFLTTNAESNVYETCKKLPLDERVNNFLICSNTFILQELYNQFCTRFSTTICSTEFAGEAKDIGLFLSKFSHFPYVGVPTCLLYGGESVVTISKSILNHDSSGGRNQELVLSFLYNYLKDDHQENVILISLGTDGIDGNSLNAGAIFCNKALVHNQITFSQLEKELELHNSSNCLPSSFYIKTGATGTNVGDIIVILLF